MHGEETLVPISMFLGCFAMVFGIVYLRTKQNMAMIEKGMNPKEFRNRPAPYRNLKNGLLFVGAGIGLTVAYFLTENVLQKNDFPGVLWGALIGIGGGIGLIASYKIEKKELLDKGADL